MSKKLAEGIDSLVLDVKFGAGAFMREKARARELATTLVSVCKHLGKPARALLTAMEQPLGRTVGNALEVAECIECLRGNGPADLMEVTYALGENMLLLAGVEKTAAAARARLEKAISSGAALQKFRELVAAQGGDPRVADESDATPILPRARFQKEVRLPATGENSSGYVASVNALEIALAALRLGAGRVRAEDTIDHAVGISCLAKVGERIEQGGVIAVVHAKNEAELESARHEVLKAVTLSQTPVSATSTLVDEIIGA